MTDRPRTAYAAAGVDVAAGERAVELMRAHVDSTRRPESFGGLGGFGGAFSIPAGYREPLMIASTDGVGTKTVLAASVRRFDTVGIDLVAMCADDVVCTGAEPLAFLDYLAVGLLDPVDVAELVGGVAAGCRDAGAALVGGETAEHPGVLEANEFDLAGCCIGVVERSRLIDGHAVVAGDVILGLASSGLHANGFSLVRGLIAQWDLDLAEPYQVRLRRTLGDEATDEALAGAPHETLATLGEVLLTPTRIYARAVLAARAAVVDAGHDLHGLAHITGGGLPGNVPRALPDGLGARVDPSALADAVGDAPDRGARWPRGGRATGDVQRRARHDRGPASRGRGRRRRSPRGARRRSSGRRGRHRSRVDRWRPIPGRCAGVDRVSAGRIAVGVSGAGSNLRALHAATGRDELGGEIVLVFADRACAALDWASGQGIDTALVADGDDGALADTLIAAGADVVVLAGYMRILGPAVLAAYEGRILNTHPSLLPAFPGAHAVRDALAHGVAVTGATVHLVDATLDGGPIVAQEAVPVLPGDDEASLHDRIRAMEHRLLPRAVALLLADAVGIAEGGRHVTIDLERADARIPMPRRALLSVSDKTGLADLGRGLVARGFELVSTGGTARALREAGLPVTDVAAVTGNPEMLDGRVKTLHPRVHGGLLADRRLDDHRRQLLGAGIAPFELVVVNLYPFAAALDRPGITIDELIEEIDIGGPSMVRAAAKNHANVAIVTTPARYDAVLAALDGDAGLDDAFRRELALEAFAHTAAYDARIAAELPGRFADAGLREAAEDPYPPTLTIALEKVETLRYGENPHQPAARYRRPGTTLDDGPFGVERAPLQGKALSYNNVLDAAAASGLGRALRGPGVVIVKHTNPCGAAERATLLKAWDAALEADPVSAFGGVVAVTREVDRALAEALTSIFLEIVVAPAYSGEALEVLAKKPNLRVLVDERLASDVPVLASAASPVGSIRTAGGAVLVTTPDIVTDEPVTWTCATRRAPTDEEQLDLDLAWRLVRGVTSNAIVLVRERRLVGMGSGQTSRVDAAGKP